MNDLVNKPKHYIGVNGLEVETVLQNFLPKIKDSYVAHRSASAIEYIVRHEDKNGLEDLKKARKNLDQAIKYLEAKKTFEVGALDANNLLIPTYYGGTNPND